MLIERKRIPDKIYYSISEVSKFTGVEPHVLRYWETKFSKLRPKRVGGNQRKYTKNDIELVFNIMDLLYNDGFTLEGAEKKIREGYGKKNSKPAATVETIIQRVPDNPPAEAPSASKTSRSQNEILQHVKSELEAILEMLG